MYNDFDDNVYRMDESQIDPNLLRNIQPKNNPVIILWIIIIANAVAEVMSLIAGGDAFETGGLNFEYMFNNHEFRRILTYMFLHANIPHFVNNMVALYIFGQSLEREAGSSKTAVIYFASGIFAGLFSVLASHLINPEAIRFAAGASGAVFGIMCASMYYTFKSSQDDGKSGMMISIILVVIYAVISNRAQVDIFSHIGGAIAGGVLAFWVSKIRDVEGNGTNLIAIGCTVLICVFGVLLADIGGEASQLKDPRIDEVKNQQIFEGVIDVTYGQCLDANCEDGKWTIFTASNKDKVVEFNGSLNYNGVDSKFRMQFTYSLFNKRWQINYASLDGKAFKSSSELGEFLYGICAKIIE